MTGKHHGPFGEKISVLTDGLGHYGLSWYGRGRPAAEQVVSHVRWVESAWIEKNLLGGTIDAPWTDDDPDREFRIAVEVPLAQLLAEYRAACGRHNELVASLDLDTPSKGALWRAEPVTLRWVLFHLIEETARHNGHLDILRELADGARGR